MTDAAAKLRGSSAWLHQPNKVAGALGGALTAYYAYLTQALPEGTSLRFGLISAVVIPITLVISEARRRFTLRTLWALETGLASPDVSQLGQAVREVRKFPTLALWWDVQHWAGAALAILGIYRFFTSEVTWALCGRILWVVSLFGPFAVVVVQPWTLLRSRVLVERLCGLGLTPMQLLEASPPARMRLRFRLMVFTWVTVLAPVLVTADVFSRLRHRSYEVAATAASLPTWEEREALVAELHRQDLMRMGTVSLLLFAVAMAAAYGVGTMVGRPIRQVALNARMLEAGTLKGPGLVPAEDEIWAVSAGFTRLHVHVSQLVEQLQRAEMKIAKTTREISETTKQYDGGAAEQASSLNETSAATEELARSARQIAENASEVSELALKTLNASNEGRESAEAFSKSTSRMREDNQAVANSVVKLNKRVQQIGKIVTFINGVADKSDLLALNAELEGTKAGDVGRGFSLVAAEMRRLAENVLESTKEIELLIEEVRDATRDAVAATDAGVATTEGGMQLAVSVTANLAEIATHAEHGFEAVKAISLATQQQQTGTDHLAEAMLDILRLTQTTLIASKQVQTANGELSSVAKDLSGVVDRFRVQETDNSGAPT